MTIALKAASRISEVFLVVPRALSRQFWGGHPNTFRTLFAWASLAFAYSLVMEQEAFERVTEYRMMRLVTDAYHWAALFALHWAAVLMDVLFGKKRAEGRRFLGLQVCGVGVVVQLILNWFGFLIWAFYVGLQDIAIGHGAINSAAERVLLVYSVWALLRTSMNRSTDHE